MARTSRLVSRPYLTVIGVIIALSACVVVYVLRQTSPYYIVHDSAFDGAVVNGVTSLARKHTDFSKQDARIIVVPHHLVAHTAIAEGVARIATRYPDTRRVIVISPDHFKRCATFACTSYGTFGTFFGDIPIDGHAIRQLVRNSLFTTSELFHKEHGVYTIVPFVRHYLPRASVVPIVISVDEPRHSEERIAFAAVMESLLKDPNTVVIFSTDFSHYLPLPDAELMDLDTKTALCAQRLEYIRRLRNPAQSDCPLCLWLATTLAAGQKTPHPYFFAHSNSAVLLNDTRVPETTSHFGIVYGSKRDSASCHERNQ